MKISCVIVSHNNGKLLEAAVMSVIRQSRPVDEIIVADDASTDGSPELIRALSHNYGTIKPILRSRNLGVSANRDLAIREASGDFITTLDGDDSFLPIKIQAEVEALRRSSTVVAFSDVLIVQDPPGRYRVEKMADFSLLDASERVRWMLRRQTHHPREVLLAKRIHLEIGGYNHTLRTYEDWDYKLRLAERPYRWAHSGTEGVVHLLRGGLSVMTPTEHTRGQYRVLRLNRELASRHVGLPFVIVTGTEVLLRGAKWSVPYVYWATRRRLQRTVRRSGAPTA